MTTAHKFSRLILNTSCLILAAIIFPAAAFASGPNLSWSTNRVTVAKDQAATVTLKLDTAGKSTTGIDVILKYNSKVASIQYATFPSPEIYPHNYFFNDFTTDPVNSVLRLTSSFSSNQTYAGNSNYAVINIAGNEVGNTELAFVCYNNQTNDTNIVESGSANDIVDCSALASLNIEVTDASASATTNDSSCDFAAPPTNFKALSVNDTTIILNWNKSPDTKNYTLFYGTGKGSYQHGVDNLSDINQFLVTQLKPGTRYYFGLGSKNGCGVSKLVTTSTSTPTKTGTPQTTLTSEELKNIPSSDKPRPTLVPVAFTSPKASATPQPVAKDELPPSTTGYQRSLPLLFILLAILIIIPLIFFFYFKSQKDDVNYGSKPPSGY